MFSANTYKVRRARWGRQFVREARINALSTFRCLHIRKEQQHYVCGFEGYRETCRRSVFSIEQIYGQFRVVRIAS